MTTWRIIGKKVAADDPVVSHRRRARAAPRVTRAPCRESSATRSTRCSRAPSSSTSQARAARPTSSRCTRASVLTNLTRQTPRRETRARARARAQTKRRRGARVPIASRLARARVATRAPFDGQSDRCCRIVRLVAREASQACRSVFSRVLGSGATPSV